MDRVEHWNAVFRDAAEEDASWFQQHPGTSLALIGRSVENRAARIVDVGAGASRLVDALLEQGYHDLTMLDVAEPALAISRARLGSRGARVRWIVHDVLTWFPEVTFDVWHDRAVFHFMLTAADREAYKRVLRTALPPGGHAILATFAQQGPERCSGLPIARYSPETLAAELGSEFRLVESAHEQHLTPRRTTQAFQYSRFERQR